jgi:crotonobetainyl-CoA:carnitine CoA-transferase CaiB-like acyl-CoA transferase
MSTRILADYGATVIRIESLAHIDALRTMRPYLNGKTDVDQSGLFHACNASKRMMSLDFANPEARSVIEDLIGWADIVCESFAPGKLAGMGWGYEALREIKPEMIMLSTCLMGQTGPLAKYAGYGNLAAAVGGFFELTGWPDRDPAGPFGAYTDYIVPKFCVSSLLAAVEHRRRTGEGQHIDVSQAEAALSFVAPALLDYEINGVIASRNGNRDPFYAPHGVYPCVGEEKWIAIAVATQEQWRSLCGALGADKLADDARFATMALRRKNAEQLDDALGKASIKLDATSLEKALQREAVPSHAVLDSAGLCVDAQLIARNHFIERGGSGAVVESTRTKLSRTPAEVRDGLPLYGRDNHWVLSDLLGYDDERITELVIAGALE